MTIFTTPYLMVPLVTTLSLVLDISQRMVRVSPGNRFSWGCLSSEQETNLAIPLWSLGRFLLVLAPRV